MKTITIIGNNGSDKPISDGGRLKTRFFKNEIEKKGYLVNFIELDGWRKHILGLIIKIKKAIKNGDRIIIMAGPSGCRLIIPLVVKMLPKKHKNDVAFCPLGIGAIDKVICDLSPEDVTDFLGSENFFGKKDEKMKKYLSNMQYITVQNDVLKKCYEKFYGLTNVVTLYNFRNVEQPDFMARKNDSLSIVYFSRIKENKGILDLIRAVKEINKTLNKKIKLDIFGENQLENKQQLDLLMDGNISYKGVANQKDAINIFPCYSLSCLPTKYHGEGTPGSLIESLIFGTPVLVSSYSQAQCLIDDGGNGFIFQINSFESLKEKIIYINENLNILNQMQQNAYESGKKYLFSTNYDNFSKYICGE